jgi:DnaK suppressor protein
MTEDKREQFKSILSRTLDDLLSDKEKHTISSDWFKDDVGDYADYASLDIDRSLSARFRERESRLAKKISSTLRKIEDGTFGICEECGRPISEKRLMARPIARLCIKCKEKEEIKEATWE